MLYTRHFYRIDEVKAALQLCISNKRSEEALFWALELIDSEEFTTIKSVLLNTWFHTIGLANIHILRDIFDVTDDEEKILYLVYSMCYVKRDITLPVMYLNGASTNKYKNRNILFELPKELVQDDKYIDTFIRSCILGKYLDAWLLSVPLWKNRLIYTYIEKLLSYKYKDGLLFDLYVYLTNSKLINKWYLRCALIGLTCFAEKYYEAPTNYFKSYEYLQDTIQSWKNFLTKKKRRIYTIPKECLYGRTYRGTLTYQDNNDEELHEPHYLLENQTIYKSILERYTSFKEFYEDNEEYDQFMDWYFPDDIPDEWSRIEREKSHGFGVNQKSDTPNIRRYFTRWVDMKYSCKIWDKELIVNKCLEALKNSISSYYIEDVLFEKYDAKVDVLKVEKNTWNLNSLKMVLSALE
jgi:hypothetical protein